MGHNLLIKIENCVVTEIEDLRTREKWVLDVPCNRCGECCTFYGGNPFYDEKKGVCKYLKISPDKKIGEPGASICTMHTVAMFKSFACFVSWPSMKLEKGLSKNCVMRYKKVR